MGREAERTGEDGRGWERTARSALSLMGDMVAIPVEGVAFYFFYRCSRHKRREQNISA